MHVLGDVYLIMRYGLVRVRYGLCGVESGEVNGARCTVWSVRCGVCGELGVQCEEHLSE